MNINDNRDWLLGNWSKAAHNAFIRPDLLGNMTTLSKEPSLDDLTEDQYRECYIEYIDEHDLDDIDCKESFLEWILKNKEHLKKTDFLSMALDPADLLTIRGHGNGLSALSAPFVLNLDCGEFLRIEQNGDCYVRGNKIDNDRHLLDAFREFFYLTKRKMPFK